MFVDRRQELEFLNSLLTREHPGPAQLALMYGRRRVGKSELLLQWAAQSGLSTTYWEAVKEPATQQRARLFAKSLMSRFHPRRCTAPGLKCGMRPPPCCAENTISSFWMSFPMPSTLIRPCSRRCRLPGISIFKNPGL